MEEKMSGMRELIPRGRGSDVAPGRHGWDHPMTRFQREIERMFEDAWRGFDLPVLGRSERAGLVSPRVDVTENDTRILVTAELPGMEEKDVELLWNDNVLTIKGEKKAEHEEKEKGYTYTERSYGSFERRIPIDTEVLSDKLEATFKNGVLTVTLPKNPEAREHFKRIPIHGAEGEKKTEKKAA
jgi:HSP20 family protein